MSASGVGKGDSLESTDEDRGELDLPVSWRRLRLVPRKTAGRGPPICRFRRPILDKPKSVNLRWPCASISRLSGLRSLVRGYKLVSCR